EEATLIRMKPIPHDLLGCHIKPESNTLGLVGLKRHQIRIDVTASLVVLVVEGSECLVMISAGFSQRRRVQQDATCCKKIELLSGKLPSSHEAKGRARTQSIEQCSHFRPGSVNRLLELAE